MKKSIILILLALAVSSLRIFCYASYGTGTLANRIQPWTDVVESGLMTIAHRGASGYAPENTIAAFDTAVQMEADMLELDVQFSQDGHAVVIHDTTVDRTSDGKGEVASLTLARLQNLDAGGWYGESFRGERIPTLEEVMERYSGQIGLLIEIKASVSQEAEHKLVGILKRYSGAKNDHRPVDRLVVQSSDTSFLQSLHKLMPELPLGVVITRAGRLSYDDIQGYTEYADYISLPIRFVNKATVGRIHQKGLKALVWTMRNIVQVPWVVEAKVDGMITDYPDLVPTHTKTHDSTDKG